MSSSSSPDALSGLRSILHSERISDVKLKGTDGIESPAARVILSCRSKVFSKMFFDDFLESKQEVVELNFDSDTIRSLLTYCYTDNIMIADVDVLKVTKECDFKMLEQKIDDDFFGKVIKLGDAANYYELDVLEEMLKKWAGGCLNHIPWLACIAFEMCYDDDTESPIISHIKEVSKEIICSKFKSCVYSNKKDSTEELNTNLCSMSFLNLSAEALGEISKWRNLNANELDIFCCLKEWAKRSSNNRDEKNDTCKRIKTCPRKEEVKDILKHINFSRIKPWDLEEKVIKSGLVEEKSLVGAFKVHSAVLGLEINRDDYYKIMNQPRLKFPSTLTVNGAGVSAINGTYESKGLYMGAEYYTRKGVWKEDQAIFYVRRTYFEQTIQWFIILFSNGKKWDFNQFYFSDVTGKSDILIPPRKWRVDRHGSDPAPTITYFT